MRRVEHALVLCWLLMTGLVVFGTVVVVDSGLMRELLTTDRSYVCAILIGMYVIGAGHSLRRTWILSRELVGIAATERELATLGNSALRMSANGLMTAAGVVLPSGFLNQYVRDILRARTVAALPSQESASADLLEAYAARMRGEHEFGWFMCDLMLKVGFLGTLIGFIWMLSSVSKQSVIDAASMQHILQDMSYGMSIALNTTLTSLVTATLLSGPYYLLGRGLDELLECAVRLTQVEILPRLESV
ncbi:MAG: MotA/TolQ/ExbB proton channel family protein [Candidatus Sericytochromatia bacterium]|uniref:MotA/TolQ/ExbB proton channel family protein n=1 Tax=Candidatus Tanganyikabacteria bacterium TaxID=2961651 RepID=A0A938BLX3_9BACT|nr:MotA/TolQ/ExbB proton channel family protein [Candidatus Tanganyikabacteria bacterium]